MKIGLATVSLAGMLPTTAALGAVSFDPNTGTGRVSQADVAPAFGWSTPQFQQNAAGIGFAYTSADNFSGVCSWMSPSGPGEQTQTVTINKTANINTTIEYDSRARKSATGFILGGFGVTQQNGGATPSVGGACQGPMGVIGTWKQVMPLTHSGTLSVTHGGISVPLPF